MAGRRAMPVDILVATGKKHLTKKEIAERKKAEIKFGDKNFRCPGYVVKNKEAYKKWQELKKLYKDVDFISSSDMGLLARYCVTYSEYLKLCEKREMLEDIQIDVDEIEEYINDSDEFDFRIKKALLDITSLKGLENINTAINKKMEMLIKMEDRLFLNPLAKIKNVPTPRKEEKVESKFSKFGG